MLSFPQNLSPLAFDGAPAIDRSMVNGYSCAEIATGANRQERPRSESMTDDKRCVLAWM